MDGDLDNGKGSVIETEGRSGGALLPLLEEAWVVALGGAGLSCRPGILGMDEYLHLCSCLRVCICICTYICLFVLVITFVFVSRRGDPFMQTGQSGEKIWKQYHEHPLTKSKEQHKLCYTTKSTKITKAPTNLEGAMAFMMKE